MKKNIFVFRDLDGGDLGLIKIPHVRRYNVWKVSKLRGKRGGNCSYITDKALGVPML